MCSIVKTCFPDNTLLMSNKSSALGVKKMADHFHELSESDLDKETNLVIE